MMQELQEPVPKVGELEPRLAALRQATRRREVDESRFRRFYRSEPTLRSAFVSHHLVRPKPATGRIVSRAEFEELKDIVDRIIFVVGVTDDEIHDLRRKVQTLDRRGHRFGVAPRSSNNLVVKQLRDMFGLPELSQVEGNPLDEMKGILQEYRDEGEDSVELLGRAREE